MICSLHSLHAANRPRILKNRAMGLRWRGSFPGEDLSQPRPAGGAARRVRKPSGCVFSPKLLEHVQGSVAFFDANYFINKTYR